MCYGNRKRLYFTRPYRLKTCHLSSKRTSTATVK
nr:MAG TPA: hypothetical protein [Caudoviricetes sp.]